MWMWSYNNKRPNMTPSGFTLKQKLATTAYHFAPDLLPKREDYRLRISIFAKASSFTVLNIMCEILYSP